MIYQPIVLIESSIHSLMNTTNPGVIDLLQYTITLITCYIGYLVINISYLTQLY